MHADDWVGVRPEIDRDEALDLLASRYLAGHGPASDRDLAAWSGLPLGDVRRGLSLVDDLVTDEEGLHRLERDEGSASDVPAPRLLGAFDPLLHGWASRADSLRGHADDGVVTSNGLFRPVALVDGHAVATWTLAAGELTITALPGEHLTSAVTAALSVEAAAVKDFLAGSPPTAGHS